MRGASDADALRLTTREFVRKAPQMRGQQTDLLQHGDNLVAPRRAVQRGTELAQRLVDDLGATDIRGSSEAKGS